MIDSPFVAIAQNNLEFLLHGREIFTIFMQLVERKVLCLNAFNSNACVKTTVKRINTCIYV